MRYGPFLLSLALVVESAGFQAPPNFSGKWIGGRQATNLAGVVGPLEMTIVQDSSSISIERVYGRNRVTIKLRLDGSPSKNVLDPGASRAGATSPPRELTSRATWDGSRLKIATEYLPPGAARKVVTIEVLAFEGGNLVVERSDEAVGGSSAPLQAGELKARKDTYRRAPK